MTPSTDHIRALFLQPKQTYSLREAAALLGMEWREVHGWVEAGELEGMETDEGLVLPWDELVSFAMGLWEQAEVEEALGAELAVAIPELLRLAEFQVRIPRLEVVALERLAEHDGRSIDTLLARHLLDLVSANSAWLSQVIPGFAEALALPSPEPARA